MADSKKNTNQEEVKDEAVKAPEEQGTEVAKTEDAQVPATKPKTSNYITHILEEVKRGFIEENEGLDLDFVHMGDWLRINKKGQFVEKDSEGEELENFGDSIDVVVGYGEKRYSLWGLEKSPEEGNLITAEKTLEDAEEALTSWLDENPEAADRYSLDDIELRYMAYVVPVTSLNGIKDGDFPTVYLMSFPKTTTIGWGRFAFDLFKGKYRKADIPAKTGANKVVVRFTTVERERDNVSWISVDFKPVGLFKPEEYGIDPNKEIGQE